MSYVKKVPVSQSLMTLEQKHAEMQWYIDRYMELKGMKENVGLRRRNENETSI